MPDKIGTEKAALRNPEAIVVGRGPAALTAAIALAEAGVSTVLAGKRPPRTDNRTTALLASSITALEKLGVWDLCADKAAPLITMRLVDATGRLWRAPEVKFDAYEIDLDAFGYNIENPVLIDALEQRAGSLSNVRLIDDEVIAVEPADDDVIVELKSGERLSAPLVVGADGRNSMSRTAAGIELSNRPYKQVALTVCLTHTRPHHDTSTEFHTASGPFTLVPLPGNRSSLVWVLRPADADAIAELSDEELALEIEAMAHSILGKMTVEPGRALFPLSVQTARRFGARRIALVGEAAHVVPPIGAQGLNLGLRDAVTIAELAATAKDDGRDIGGADVLAAYEKARRGDVTSRGMVIDIANRTLLSDFLPLQGLRGLGLFALDKIGPLRRAVMREGIAPRFGRPRLMRDETV
ncbi:UbiH/UbiF family hydroxylase [Pseudolabrys sp. FHR47]|uniref:UbiH/UbiF family hydroxylase n=1 Tax=Pseudolabrys sp. FHR47 TaxID=2562284 RepID=UPI0010BE6BE4|nr:UbiH/UbiF family hydroxylase [Pseudolabrys sp. FHR47]